MDEPSLFMQAAWLGLDVLEKDGLEGLLNAIIKHQTELRDLRQDVEQEIERLAINRIKGERNG